MIRYFSFAILLLHHLGTITIHAKGKDDFSLVTFGSAVKLYNRKRDVRLHSHEVKYGTGSEQQSVTGTPQPDDRNSYWVVTCPHGVTSSICERGVAVKCDDVIRLRHQVTRLNLHSHHYESPLSQKQEVSAFGNKGIGDELDNWKVVCTTTYWKRKSKVRLLHVITHKYLHASANKYSRPIEGQHEVCASSSEDGSTSWVVKEGVHIREKKVNQASNQTTIHDEL